MPIEGVARLATKLQVGEVELLRIVGIAPAKYRRRQTERRSLTAHETDRLLRVARVASQAERTFGNAAKATRWLNAEHALLGARPFVLLATDAGARDVEDELLRITFGDFS
jgi:putative toxin-antitoxin system antitoxin component (TIGR02293 family)